MVEKAAKTWRGNEEGKSDVGGREGGRTHAGGGGGGGGSTCFQDTNATHRRAPNRRGRGRASRQRQIPSGSVWSPSSHNIRAIVAQDTGMRTVYFPSGRSTGPGLNREWGSACVCVHACRAARGPAHTRTRTQCPGSWRRQRSDGGVRFAFRREARTGGNECGCRRGCVDGEGGLLPLMLHVCMVGKAHTHTHKHTHVNTE